MILESTSQYTTDYSVEDKCALIKATLIMADNALIHGHRLSEWCGHGPILEQDIAITNMSLDHIGQCRPLYQYAASLINTLPKAEQMNLFKSPALQRWFQEGKTITEDDLAFLRDAWDFRNNLLVELPNKDWAYTIIKCYLYDTYMLSFYEALQYSTIDAWKAIAEKSLKEVRYQVKWSAEWVLRLGDGTEDSNRRLQNALNDYWPYCKALYQACAEEVGVKNFGYPTIDFESNLQKMLALFAEAQLQAPAAGWGQEGGKNGIHSEHLGYLLAEMQYMQRAYPGMEW
jgi:ring-1,2-phenylacetyl-CoA epoxidase subunit PaaC